MIDLGVPDAPSKSRILESSQNHPHRCRPAIGRGGPLMTLWNAFSASSAEKVEPLARL